MTIPKRDSKKIGGTREIKIIIRTQGRFYRKMARKKFSRAVLRSILRYSIKYLSNVFMAKHKAEINKKKRVFFTIKLEHFLFEVNTVRSLKQCGPRLCETRRRRAQETVHRRRRRRLLLLVRVQ